MKTVRKKKEAPSSPCPDNPDTLATLAAQPGLTDEERFCKLEEAVNRRIDELLADSQDITPSVVKDTLAMLQAMRNLRPEFLGQSKTVISWEDET